jgi:hypothetical protein
VSNRGGAAVYPGQHRQRDRFIHLHNYPSRYGPIAVYKGGFGPRVHRDKERQQEGERQCLETDGICDPVSSHGYFLSDIDLKEIIIAGPYHIKITIRRRNSRGRPGPDSAWFPGSFHGEGIIGRDKEVSRQKPLSFSLIFPPTQIYSETAFLGHTSDQINPESNHAATRALMRRRNKSPWDCEQEES